MDSPTMYDVLAENISQNGPMRFDRYWDTVLYTPGLGYYAGGTEKFGSRGDFVTAPGLGSLFGKCLARQLATLLRACPKPGIVLELGAGDGSLARDVLLQLAEDESLCEEYWILDRSGDLRARQQENLKTLPTDLFDKIRWLDREPQNSWQGVLFGNEVVDALAARRFQYRDDRWDELYVACVDGELTWDYQIAEPAVARHLQDRNPSPLPGTFVEVHDQLEPWLKGLTHMMHQGAMLFVDYGYSGTEYYARERTMGTLICHDRHRAHDDPLRNPGTIDVSISVDFTALAEAMDANAFEPTVYVSQASLLMANDLAAFLHELPTLPAADQLSLANEVKRLTLPSEMGERFQALIGLKGIEPELAPLAIHNRIDRL